MAEGMDVFVDANVLLSLYRLSGPDLEELKKLVALGKAGKLSVHINDQIRREFVRNRERTIRSSLDEFMKGRNRQPIPNIIEQYPQASELRASLASAARISEQLNQRALSDAASGRLKADEVVETLFRFFPPAPITDAVITRARNRHELGDPPGKGSSIGDEISWEWLLDVIANGRDLHLVSGDGDYESDLHRDTVKEALVREWTFAKKSSVFLYKSLPEFLKQHFPEIKLANEIEKAVAIEMLIGSRNFATTHRAIAELESIDDFTDADLANLFTAFFDNDQVGWILGDPDVERFAVKILDIGRIRKLQAADKLQAMLDKLGKARADRDVDGGDDDEIPF